MDQELKQRLIGASVIIALAIIFIPMLFDNEVKKTSDKNIDIVIPESGSHPLSIKTFSLNDEPSKQQVANETVPESDLSLADDKAISRDLVDGNGLIDSSDSNLVVNDSKSDQDQLTKEAEDNRDKVESQPAPEETLSTENEVTEKATEAKQTDRVDTVSDKRVEVTGTDSENNIFRVKLGSFSKAENAQQVKNKLAQQGIGSLVELAPDRALYRVWSEALYQSKSKAEDYVAAVNKLNLNIGTPKIITINEDDIKAIADRGQLGWVVQLGSFAAKNNALDLRNKLKLAGFIAFVDLSKNSQGETRYRLRVGPVNSRDQATQLKQQISDKFQLKGLVKTHELASLVD